MQFRKANRKDIGSIMSIIKHGKEYLKEQGVNQWQDGYPNEEKIFEDMDNGYSYLVEEQGQIVATVAISFDGEITYEKIYEGQWLTDYEFCVIHRVAVHKENRGSGVSKFMMNNIESLCKKKGIRSIKVDTHRDNIPMQEYLKKNGFIYCGVIYLLDGDERLAFEKILNQ